MDNLILAFNVVLPLFLCIVLGYFLRRIKMLDAVTLKSLNKLCFKVFLPFYLFNNLYTTDIGSAFNIKLIATGVGGILALWGLMMFFIPRMEKEDARRGVMIQGIFRSNFALFGLPVALSLCGEANMGPTSLMIGVMVPVYNVLAVITLETFRGGKPSIRKILRGIATNPLIISSLLGIVANLLDISLPTAVSKSIVDLGRIATPLSLVALGGEFVFSSIRDFRRQLITVVSGKLVLAPMVMVIIAALLGFRNEYLVPILIMFGAPTAVSSFPMAQQMGGDSELAASIVVFTTALAILTIFLWIFILKQLMLI